MIRGLTFATICAMTFSLASNVVAEPVTLKFKFPDGRTTTTETTVSSDQTLTLGGNELLSGSEQTLVVTTTNGKRGADGMLTMESKIDALKAEVRLPGSTELEFDSSDPDADPPGTQFDFLLDVFKATAGSKWTTTVNQENEIVSVEGRDDMLKDLPETIQEAMKEQLDPQYLKQVANDELNRVPSEPVDVGDSWERTNTIRLDSGQRLTFTTKYTYAGTVEQEGQKLHKLDSDVTKVDYTADAGSPLKVLESDLKPVDSTGVTLFDAQAGQIVSQTSNVRMQGTLKLEIMGTELPGDLDLTMKHSVKLKQ